MMDPKNLIDKIQILTEHIVIEEIHKGFSSDRIYIIHFDGNEKCILRTSNISQSERKKAEYDVISILQKYNIRTSKPIEYGCLADLELCYYILTYIEGIDARDALPSLSQKEQYQIGLDAGKDLKKMHSLPAPSNMKPWNDRIVAKYTKYLNAYQTCGVKLAGDDRIINFIEENLHFLKNRPNRFQHDDFHAGNLIVNDKQYAGVIDFNRFDWGDPIHDFLKVGLFSKEVSIPFSIGQLDGYFNNEIPDGFWMLYSIYLAMNIFSSVVWTKNVVPEKLDEMIIRLYGILEDHKYFENTKPIWYEKIQL
ncbi:phosphotransferase [Bacillus sp. S/N-304-OC-R1]|nr:phosphotransferase [Bacillus sp. S/N-304-OC-R1]